MQMCWFSTCVVILQSLLIMLHTDDCRRRHNERRRKEDVGNRFLTAGVTVQNDNSDILSLFRKKCICLIDLLRSSTTDSRVLWCCYSKYLLTAEGELYLLLNSALRHLFHWPPTCFIFWCFIISYFFLFLFLLFLHFSFLPLLISSVVLLVLLAALTFLQMLSLILFYFLPFL